MQPAGVLEHRVNDLVGLPAVRRGGDLAGALADQRGQHGGVEPVERGVGQAQQRVVLADPLVAAVPLHHLEAGRAVAGDEQQRQVAALPASLQERAGARGEQLAGSVTPVLPGLGHRLARGLLVGEVVLLPEGQEQLALAAEVVVQAADAGAGALDDVGDAGLGEAARGEDLPGGVEQRALRLRGASPLPRAAACLARPVALAACSLEIRLP